MADDIQRSLGRIEGTQDQILAKLEQLRIDFGDHKNEDQRNFSAVRALFYGELRKQDETRESHLADQDKKLDAIRINQDTKLGAIQSAVDQAKGASWILRILGNGMAALVGGLAALAAEFFRHHHL